MNQNLDEIISAEDKRNSDKYFRRFLFHEQREEERARIQRNLTRALIMGTNLFIFKGVKDLRTGKEVIPSEITKKEFEEASAYKVEGGKMGLLVGEPRYNLTRKFIYATVRNESNAEIGKQMLDLENSLEDDIFYIASKASLEELKEIKEYLQDIIDRHEGDWSC